MTARIFSHPQAPRDRKIAPGCFIIRSAASPEIA
jgi:hypothetical protein